MTEDEAYAKFKAVRFEENGGKPFCPRCGSCEASEIKNRKFFSCKGCWKQFSVTSGTIFASRKLQFRDLLLAIAIFANGVKGHSALQLSRELQVQYKTAFVLLHKIREAIGAEQDFHDLGGHVEIDGAYYGGKLRKANWAKNRRDRRRAENQNGKKRVMVVVREVGGRTMPLGVYREEWDAHADILNRVHPATEVHMDEARHWDSIEHKFRLVERINHQEAYSNGQACTNWVESFHMRVRRAERGIHHHVSGPYLLAYGREMAWREDHRRKGNGEQFEMMLHAVTHHPVSRRWKGYWQRRASDGRPKWWLI